LETEQENYLISRGFGETLKVKYQDFLYAYNLEQWQLDKMIKYGRKRGGFNFKGYKYIESAPKKRFYKKVSIDMTNRVLYENKLPRGSFKAEYYLNNKISNFKEIALKTKLSVEYVKRLLLGVKSVKLNGANIKIKRICTIGLRIYNNDTGEVQVVENMDQCLDIVKTHRSQLYNYISAKKLINKKYLVTRIKGER